MNGGSRHGRDAADRVAEGGPSHSQPPKLLDRLGQAIRVRHYSPRTEVAYRYWVRRFILFHGIRHPSGLAAPEIAAFLNHLAVEENVSASTQNQALSPTPYRTEDAPLFGLSARRTPLVDGVPMAG